MSGPDADLVGLVRPYRPFDRSDVLRIAADTAFFGEPVERYMEDRRLFNEAFYVYYTDVEPAFCWIAEANGKVAGFLAGCVDSKAKAGRYMRLLLPGLLMSLVRGKYRFGPLTWNYLRCWAGAALRGEIPHVDFRDYPAHLHINVDANYRGHGLGRGLLNAYLGQLQDLRVPGVHLATTSLNEAACRLYESVGFRVVEARPTHMWSGFIQKAVENLCYGLLLPKA